eukprot:TRINITY_DN209_c0_g1_i3.p1 TRINITY_DN209_c0_g1~~TRINITY_DN209_c0_g1_i3.p1  ORF type:complete len:187 (+),score=51.99 TRINITY_DN209_c0_g1_i3:635-1195(+)
MEHGLISRTTHQLTDKGKTPKCGFTHKVHPSMVHKEPTPPPPPPPPPPPSQSLSEMWSPEMFLPILKDSILPMVVDQLLKVKVDKIEDTINGGKIDFTIEEISMEKVMVPPEHTKIDVEDTNIIVSMFYTFYQSLFPTSVSILPLITGILFSLSLFPLSLSPLSLSLSQPHPSTTTRYPFIPPSLS